AALYELIGTSVTALNNLIADLAAEDEAIYAEMENVRTYVAQVYNALSYEIAATDAALQAHIAAFEAFKEAYEAKVDELEATDENLYVEINGLREVITTINNHIDDLRAEDEAIYLEINGLRENLTQLQNAINDRIDEEVAALEDKILESVQDLESMIRDTQDGLSAALRLIAENSALIAANAAAIADLEAAVEMLKDWVTGQEENNELQAELIAKVYEIVGEIEEQIVALTQKDNELEGLIGSTALALQTYMDENNARLADLETYIKENINSLGAGIRNLEAIINDLEASFGARLNALEERMDAAEDKIADLEDQAAAMAEAIENIEAAIEDLEAMDEALAAEIANVDAAAKAELKKARKELQDQIDALVEAKEDLQVRVAFLEDLVADNSANIELNRKEIEANVKAIAKVAEQLGSLQGTVNAMMQANASIHAALQQKDAALEESIKKAVEALAGAVSRITAVEQSIEAIYDLAKTLATKEQLDNATADLTAKIEREIATLQGQLVAYIAQNGANIADIRTELQNVNALIESLTERMDKVEFDVEDLNNRLDALIEEYTKAIAALQGKDAELEEELKTLLNNFHGLKDEVAHHNNLIGLNQINITKLFTQVAELEAKLNAKVAELGDRINSVYSDLVAADNFFFEYFTKEIEGLEKAIKAVRALVVDAAQAAQQNDAQLEAKLKEHIAKIIAQIEANITSVIVDCAQNKADIANLKTAVEEAFKLLNEKVSDLTNRVQSLVYVPEYADHKATIEYAVISPLEMIENDTPAEAYANREDGKQLPTYVVKASDLKYLVKAENAADVAQEIANNWASVLDYEVKDVKTTRAASETGADLEIVKVKAEGEHIIVSVVAKNFDAKFFEKKRMGGIYSAALVLSDENNTRTTEYTNLVPGTPAEFQMSLFLPVEDPEYVGESNMRYVADGEVIKYLMPCNDTKTVKSAVKPILGFIPAVDGQPNITNPVSFFTTELMVEEGYDVEVAKKAVIVCYDGTHEREFYANPHPDKNEGVKTNKYFNIGEGPKWDYHYTVKEGTTFDSVGENSTVTYEYTCGNITATLTYDFVLSNAQVDITITKTIPWSIAFAQKYIDGKKLYKFNAEADADENGIVVTGADGYRDLESVLSQKTGAKKNYKMGENGWFETATQSIAFQDYVGGDALFALVNYSFNNSYKTVYTTTNDELNVDYNISIIVNLVGYQNEITVPIEDLKFNLDGKLGEFVTPADLKGEAYKKLTEKYDFLGFGEKNSENWDSMFASYVGAYSKGELGVPYVNGTKSNWVRNLNGLTEARLFWNDKAHQVIDGVNTITWSVNPVNDFTVKFVVSGEITKPAGSLIYADSYVEHGVAEAKGQLEKNGEGVLEYSIIESHLPFYFNATAIDYDAHDYTVKFEVKENTEVTLSNDVVSVLAKDGSYYPLENNAILDWADYTGLEVEVVATLYANGYQIDQKELKIITKDPLHFTVGNVEAQRVMREDVTVQLFQNAVLTSSIEPEKENLISFLTSTGALKSIPFAFEYAKSTYGVDVKFVLQDPTAESHVYYFDNTGKKTYLAKTQYEYDADKGHLTIKGDDAVAKNYYADFTAIMSSRICSGEHRVDFQVKFLGTK
ncbi:MAG: hypothetical protein IKU36_05035, partial [Bacteroidales bacterium]|nr:hypothetical protein [Bacteroidales bacterium]